MPSQEGLGELNGAVGMGAIPLLGEVPDALGASIGAGVSRVRARPPPLAGGDLPWGVEACLQLCQLRVRGLPLGAPVFRLGDRPRQGVFQLAYPCPGRGLGVEMGEGGGLALNGAGELGHHGLEGVLVAVCRERERPGLAELDAGGGERLPLPEQSNAQPGGLGGSVALPKRV